MSRTSKKLTGQVEVGQDDAGQEPMHVKLDTAVLHVLCDDGLHRAQSQHARLMDLPPFTLIHSGFIFPFFPLLIKSETFSKILISQHFTVTLASRHQHISKC